MALKTVKYAFICGLLTFSAAVGFSEAYLRHRGIPPANFELQAKSKICDPVLGWKPLPGINVTHEPVVCGTGLTETVWPDTSRASRPQQDKPCKYRVLLLGCSYCYGQGLEDHDTFAWRLNERFPEICFDNFGVSAYGTYNCLLREQQCLSRTHYDLVLYLPIVDHLRRNATPRVYTPQGNRMRDDGITVIGPYVSLNSRHELVFHPASPHWFGEDYLSSIHFAKRAYYSYLDNKNSQETPQNLLAQKLMYLQLIQLMYETASQHKAQFAVCVYERIGGENELQLLTKLQCKRMNAKEYAEKVPYELPFDYIFLGDGKEGATSEDDPRLFTFPDPVVAHPGPLRNANWAKNIAKYVSYKLLGGPVFQSIDKATALPKKREIAH